MQSLKESRQPLTPVECPSLETVARCCLELSIRTILLLGSKNVYEQSWRAYLFSNRLLKSRRGGSKAVLISGVYAANLGTILLPI